MGLLVHTTFETPQGIVITNVYVRICSVTAEFRRYNTFVTIKCESHVTREKRLENRQPLVVPKIPTYYTIGTPVGSGWNDMAHLYSAVKEQMIADGFEVVEDVNPDPYVFDPFAPPTAVAEEPPAETPPS